MAFFSDLITSVTGTGSQTLGTIGKSVNTLTTSGLGSLLRSKNLPAGGETGNKLSITNAEFHQGANRDWRVKLSLPAGYETSDIIAPLRITNGFVFPYTPQIQIQHSASYQSLAPVHNNYPFLAYENSKVDAMQISGEFYCEDSADARYWVAAIHYLKSVTKMVYGQSANTGSPPPVVKLNGYGDYVFKNVPVVITQFSVDLPKEVDYISTGLSSDGAQNIAEKLANFIGPPKALSMVMPNMQGVTWVPVKSTVSVTVQPLYSREQVRQFSLDSFVKGEYVFNGTGYL